MVLSLVSDVNSAKTKMRNGGLQDPRAGGGGGRELGGGELGEVACDYCGERLLPGASKPERWKNGWVSKME